MIEVDTNNHVVYANLACLLKLKGDLQNSISYFEKALQLYPNYPEAHHNLGLAFKEQGDFDKAFSATLNSLEARPDYLSALLNLCNMYKEGDIETIKIMSLRAINYNREVLNDLTYIEAISCLGKDFTNRIVAPENSAG